MLKAFGHTEVNQSTIFAACLFVIDRDCGLQDLIMKYKDKRVKVLTEILQVRYQIYFLHRLRVV